MVHLVGSMQSLSTRLFMPPACWSASRVYGKVQLLRSPEHQVSGIHADLEDEQKRHVIGAMSKREVEPDEIIIRSAI